MLTEHTPDVERSSISPEAPSSSRDPYMFSSGVKTDDELSALRAAKRGKRLESYHKKQNAVRTVFSLSPVICLFIDRLLASAYRLPPEADGGAHGRRKG